MSTPTKENTKASGKRGFGIGGGKPLPGGSYAIRFSAAAMDDDDLDVLYDDTSPKAHRRLQFEVTEPETENGQDDRAHSASAPVSEVTTPVVDDVKIPSQPVSKSPSQAEVITKEDQPPPEKSLLSNIRERFEGRLPDQLNSFLERLESELTNDSDEKKERKLQKLESDEKKERRLQKVESLDEKKLKKSESFEYVKNKLLEKRDSFIANRSGHSRNASLDSNASTGDLAGTVSSNSEKTDKSSASKSTSSSFEIVTQEDLLGAEPFEDFSGMLNNSNANISTPKSENGKSRSVFTTFMKPREKPSSNKPVAMSLSGLLSVTDVDEDAVEATEDDLFFDPKDETPSKLEDVSNSFETQTKKAEKAGLTSTNGIPWKHKLFGGIIAIIAFFIIPMPTFMSGLVVGAVLTWTTLKLHSWLYRPPTLQEPFRIPNLKSLPPLRVPVMKENKNEENRFTGWMNELYQYKPEEYSINLTHSVYVQLEGTKLRLQRPKINIPRRAMWDDPTLTATFVHQRHFDLEGSRVFLLPEGLVNKRLWSKKYPVCVALAKAGSQSERKVTPQPSEDKASQNATLTPSSSTSSFEGVTKQKCDVPVLYLFARTCREKEEWYRRFEAAAAGKPLCTRLSDLVKQWELNHPENEKESENATKHTRHPSLELHQSMPPSTSVSSISAAVEATQNQKDKESSPPPAPKPKPPPLIQYFYYMGKLMPAKDGQRWRSPTRDAETPVMDTLCDPNFVWLNTGLGRLFWDFLNKPQWAELMRDKIQRKLSKIHVPYFIDELTVRDLDLGDHLPTIRRVSPPYLDERGLWIDMDIIYDGGLQMSLETKVNLMKLKKTAEVAPASEVKHHTRLSKRSAVYDSDEEDSAESSTDDEVEETPENPDELGQPQAGTSRGRKLLRLVDKITQSRYFQQATEYKYIKRAMEGVSNTRLVLSVELKSCIGTLSVNIPPPPSDRLWYGFRGNPKLWLSAKPKVGQREVTMTHITEWIQKKLAIEFQRIFVMPNMDDVPIALMCDQLCVQQASSSRPASPQPDTAL